MRVNRVGVQCAGTAFVVAAMFGGSFAFGGGSAGAAPITPSPFNTDRRVSVPAGAVPIAGDFDGDNHADVFWYRPGAGADVMWWGTGTPSALGSVRDEFVVNGSYRPVVGDFNGDDHTDIAWPVTRGAIVFLHVWFGKNNRTFLDVAPGVPNVDTFTYFSGDFNGDGYDDLFAYAPGRVSLMSFGAAFSGDVFSNAAGLPIVRGVYTPTATDFNGDGLTDVYWAAHGTGQDYLWVNHANVNFRSWPTGANVPLTSFAGEFNGDAYADLFEYATGPAPDQILTGYQSTNYPLGSEVIVVPNVVGTYTPVVADFDGSGEDDIIWYTGNGTASPFWIHR